MVFVSNRKFCLQLSTAICNWACVVNPFLVAATGKMAVLRQSALQEMLMQLRKCKTLCMPGMQDEFNFL